MLKCLIMKAGLLYILLIYSGFVRHSDSTWELDGSSKYAISGESFTLTCDPRDTTIFGRAVVWRRGGTIKAVLDFTNACDIQGPNPQYQFTCEPGPIYKLIIPSNVMTNSQNNSLWRCESSFGGVGNRAEYTLVTAVPVGSVSIDGDSNYPALNVLYENTQKTFTCVTQGCYPESNITIITTGVTEGHKSEKHETQSNGLIVTTVTQAITVIRDSRVKTIRCLAKNIKGREPITSQEITLDVYYSPIISLNKSPVVVSEGQDFTIICSAIGNPKPIVNWVRSNETYTSDEETSAIMAFKKVTKQDTGIYTCKAESEVKHGNKSIIFRSHETLQVYVYYMTVNKPTHVCLPSDRISISCCSVINSSKPLRFLGWKHIVGETNIRVLKGEIVSTNNNSITLDYCGYYDSGTYICQAAVDLTHNNTWHFFNSSIELTVPAQPVVSSSVVMDKYINNKRTMVVKYYSVPKPKIVEWIKDGEKLTYSNKYQQITTVKNVTMLFYDTSVIVTGYESSLSIVNAVDLDLGTYTFRVINSEGSAQIKIELNSIVDNGNYPENITGIIVGGCIVFVAIVSILVVIFCFYKRRTQQNHVSGNQPVSKDIQTKKTQESDNEEGRQYQDVDIQMYEVLGDADKSVGHYETLQKQENKSSNLMTST